MPKETPAPGRTTTNWKAFQDAGLVPVAIECQAYPPTHLNDTSCHSKLLFNAETLKAHCLAEHGGAYQFYLRKTDGRPAKLWDDLMVSGLEAQDFRCSACNAILRFHPTSFLAHLKGHRGNTRQSYAEIIRRHPKAIGCLNVTVSASSGQVT